MLCIIRPLFYSSLIENFCLESYSPGLVHALKSNYVCVMPAPFAGGKRKIPIPVPGALST